MSLKSDRTKGWVGSVLLHLLIALILFFWQVSDSTGEPEFIEVTWGSASTARNVPASRPSLAGTQGKSAARTIVPKTRAVDLPERKFDLPDEVLRMPEGKKIDVDEKPERVPVSVAENSQSAKESGAGTGMGQKEKFLTPGSGDLASDISDPLGAGSSGIDVGKGVSMSMQWSDGGTRKRIGGELPDYPSGANVEAQIKVEAVVTPEGGVKSLKPAQKGNTRLEDAALKAVRLWQFEPLRKSSPQLDQTCMITFNFKLK